MNRKLYITASDMLELRRQGMSNHDIAKSLDISYNTVRRYIGRQGGKIEGLAAFKDEPKEKPKAEAAPAIPRFEPKPIKESYELGKLSFELDHCDRVVYVEKEGEVINLDFSDVPNLVQFFAWAMSRLEGNDEQVRQPESVC